MLVSQILNSKTEVGVISIRPDATLTAAAELLSSKRIGVVIVSKEEGKPLGILSERDIVRDLGEKGPACLSGLVSQLMTKKMVTCVGTDTADSVLETMTRGRFRHMPVMDGDTMIGMISIGDAVKARLAELSMERDALEGMVMGH
ncbi:CBS domain-containing protein [Candidatus Halocynthiibacter alkanivorans]|uniref:CBS domain-containing protein n=1 Tax=Candidatus Halocynthiibacter alkanivorans TaxID=2267619 RepID=UPI000DF2E241|nr:CBS domain-containing protein [Candidatus Halocynthiibacter alkanivorans]